MFNHSDSLLTSSWHSQVLGRKWWYVCGHHNNGEQACYEGILKPGEILYYPKRWHHETQCIETRTMTLTDTVAKVTNAEDIFNKAYGECTGQDSLNFDFSAALCDKLVGCSKYWQDRAAKKGLPWKDLDFAKWRDHANPDRLRGAEATKPTDSNYDGRNYITEL